MSAPSRPRRTLATRNYASPPGASDAAGSSDEEEDVKPAPVKPAKNVTPRKQEKKRKRVVVESSDEEDEVEAAVKEEEEEEEAEEGDESEYEIEGILDAKQGGVPGHPKAMSYFCKWKGYGEDENSWVLEDDAGNAKQLISAFWKRRVSSKAPKTKAKAAPAPRKSAAAATTMKAAAPKPKLNKRKAGSDDDDGSDYKEEGGADDDDDEDFEDAASELEEAPAESDEDAMSDVLPDRHAMPKKKKRPATRKSAAGDSKKLKELDESLPPIHALPAIFADLVSNSKGLVNVVQHLRGRKLRVGTMCSGTESPLLALSLISRAVKAQHDIDFEVEHVFSCEIEPFKQAYIERNFSPPILFRDVCELGGEQARTAYGGLVDVPGGIDMLVAGTSCVDYSGLNNVKKGIDAGGESGRTFHGMLDYVKKHQPPIVILENVCGAPWDRVVQKFATIKYKANYMRLDTKQYYIPHTRTRVYLVAVPFSTKGDVPGEWEDKVKALARPASVPLEAFLLPTDDPRIHRAREDLSRASENKDGVKRAPTDWSRCESRHARARVEEQLGQKRPLTSWTEGGGQTTMPDGAWCDWANAQTERVKDLMDISLLRLAKDGVDVSYKSAVWNLSQNVDRNTGSSKLGICPCLTPTMIPYLTNRGGPVVGLEALSLQGLPTEELLLTRESEDQLADLSGNAMSTTVVGASMIAALILTYKNLASGPGSDDDAMLIEAAPSASVDDRIVNEDKLQERPLDLTVCAPCSADLFRNAIRSARKCVCEGRAGIAKAPIVRCDDCGHTSCTSCAGKPEHNYVPDTTERMQPGDFEKELKDALPMRVTVKGLDRDSLNAKVEALKACVEVDSNRSDAFITAVSEAVNGAEFHFRDVTRKSVWSAMFRSPRAKLELHLDPKEPEWRLYVDADESLPVNHPLRKVLLMPVARLRLPTDGSTLLTGTFGLHVPVDPKRAFELEIAPAAEAKRVPSWKAQLGLIAAEDETWPSRIKISGGEELADYVDRPIDGEYDLLSKCGTACNALHRRAGDESAPLFFFLDPSRANDASEDFFVFSTDNARVDYGSARPLVAALNPKWRPITNDSETQVEVRVPFIPSELPGSGFDLTSGTAAASSATYSLPAGPLHLKLGQDECSHAQALLSARVDAASVASQEIWTSAQWVEIDLLHQGPEVFEKLAWITGRVPPLDVLKNWAPLEHDETAESCACSRCCPPAPSLEWRKTTKGTLVAVEDGIEAGKFEQALKNRPTPFVVQLRKRGDVAEFRIGLNVATLAHKALARLPKPPASFVEGAVQAPTVSWRLSSSFGFDPEFGLHKARKFTLTSNKRDLQNEQPPDFKINLRPEQLRSLNWMIRQENAPTPWVEEEVSEAVLSQYGWHAEAKAERVVNLRGGVLADEVGYGKTAITLGLVSAQRNNIVLPVDSDLIPTKATLIIVPGHLVKQWPSEIAKFTGDELNVVEIGDVKDLKALTVSDICKADIIVVSLKVFHSNIFWPHIGDFAAGPRTIKNDLKGGRYFRACLDEAVEAIPAQLNRLREEGSAAVLKTIKEARERRKDEVIPDLDQSKRKVAKQYQKAEDSEESNEDEDEDSDAPPKKKTKTNSKKAAASKSASKKADGDPDPWQLGSSEVKKNWKKMRNPPLAMFSFNRLVIDEYTYLDARQRAGVHRLRAASRWILSGTPPLADFAEIKTIASLLDIHLGVDDDNDGRSAKDRVKEQTDAERFHSFRDVHTSVWHARRDEVAQKFLDIWVRQNCAEIDEIPYEEHVELIELPTAEMAIYRELEHHLKALDMTMQKTVKGGKKGRGDREMRLMEALGQSASAEEALMKRCSHFAFDFPDSASIKKAQEVCERILNSRSDQLRRCREEVERSVLIAAEMQRYLEKHGLAGKAEDNHFLRWIRDINVNDIDIGDPDAVIDLRRLAEECGCGGGKLSKIAPRSDGVKTQEFKEWAKLPEKTKDNKDQKAWVLREHAHELRRLIKEFVGRVRSRRYFETLRNIQQRVGEFELAELNEIGILSCCGHSGPYDEVLERAKDQVCVEPGCNARPLTTHVVRADSLGSEGLSGKYGAKIERLVELVKAVPKKDRILVFVQFDDLLNKVEEALLANNVDVVRLKGTSKGKSKTLEEFQQNIKGRVLLLEVTNASASGANLTVANHAFFISPLLTPSQDTYDAYETQAIGRIRRYGQAKPVHIYRLLTLDTIDVETYENRTDRKVEDPRRIEEMDTSG